MREYDPPGGEPAPDSGIPLGGAGGSGGGGGGCDGKGGVQVNLDANGYSIPNADCVDLAESVRRQNKAADRLMGQPQQGSSPGGAGSPAPAGRPNYGPGPNYGPAPMFSAPEFQWGEQWQAPTLEQAQNEPGYQFAANEGRRALEQSAAAKGVLGSGGTLKDINAWGNKFADQNYSNVVNRDLQGYQTRFGTAKDVFDRFYTGKKDEFAPKLFEWQTGAHGKDLAYQTNAQGANLAFNQQWQNYWKDNLSAQDIWGRQT